METIRFGSTSMEVSPICRGCMSYGSQRIADRGRSRKSQAGWLIGVGWNWASNPRIFVSCQNWQRIF